MLPQKERSGGYTRSRPSQDSFPADPTMPGDLAFVINASRVRPECCADPSRPPRKPDKCPADFQSTVKRDFGRGANAKATVSDRQTNCAGNQIQGDSVPSSARRDTPIEIPGESSMR